LQQLAKPEREEFSSYIFNIYNILRNEEQWNSDPYVACVKNIYRNSKQLSKALKRLATFIKKNYRKDGKGGESGKSDGKYFGVL